MGEDRTMCAEKKSNEVISPCRHRHSSVISSCSEDAESESTSAGYPPSPDEEREEELEYGPGIVNKLRTRFLSITLKQTRGSNMRRSCSMENLLDQDRPLSRTFPSEKIVDETDSAPARPPWGNLKRAKSMDTLLMEMNPDKNLHEVSKVVKSGLVPTICDEELPKPDTVKTYKRMFEPAESRRGSNCRRPPVLRASARSSSGSKLVSSSPSAKVNGTSRNKFSAKQSTPVKAQSPDPTTNGSGKKSVNGEPTRPLYNGCHIVKATPVKISNVRNGKEVDSLNSINRLLNKKEVHFAPKTDIICNGNGNHQEILKIKSNEEVVKQFTKSTISNSNMKPKVPPNRPSLRSPKPLIKTCDQKLSEVITPKSKPFLINGLKKPCEINNKCDLPKSPVLKSPEPKLKDSKIPNIKSPPPETKYKDDFAWPPEQKLKDKAPPIPSTEVKTIPTEIQLIPEADVKIEATITTSEKTIKNRIQILAESSAKDEIQPPEKDTISKINERTCVVSPEFNNNSDKPLKAPPKVPTTKPVNGIVEPIKKHMNGFVDPGKKPITESATEKPIVPSSSVPDNKLSNGLADSAKKVISDFIEHGKQTENGITGLVNKPASASADPAKQTATGLTNLAKKPSMGLSNPPKQIANGLANSTNKPSNGLDPAKKQANGLTDHAKKPSTGLPDSSKKIVNGFSETTTANATKQPAHDSPDVKRPIKKSQAQTTSMVFDFRGKDVVPHVAVLPVPFGCKALHPKKRSEDAAPDEDEDEDYVDYSVPPPSGVVFEGENVKIGRGSILATRNKDLKIKFDDDVDGNTFVYPSETSLLEEPERTTTTTTTTNEVIPNGQPPPSSNSKLKTNTSIGSSSAGGLSTYTPSVLRTMDNFEPGMFRAPASSPDKDPENRGEGEEENEEDLKPADPERISTWSLSAGTSDLLF